MINGMKIVVTGGAGFIASHIVDRYLELGHSVAVIDDLSTGFRKNVHRRARFYEIDIRDARRIGQIFKKENPDMVNHHAAIAEVVKSLRDPIPTLEVNVIGTVNVLCAGGECGIKKFIFSSTGGAIYGEPKKIPAHESTPPAPLSPYGLSKLLSEECIRFYAQNYGFDYLIFRYPNVFGPRQNPKGEAGVVAIFTGLMKRGGRPTIFGDGTKTRDYMYVSDVVAANVAGLTRGRNVTLNIGWGRNVSDQMVFNAVAKGLNFTKGPIFKPLRRGEVRNISLAAAKAKKILGWKPKLSFERGIGHYLESFRDTWR